MIRAIIASTIVLGLAGLVATLAHRASASVRHAIWFVGLATALGVGALAAVGPVLEVESRLVNVPDVVQAVAGYGSEVADVQPHFGAPAPTVARTAGDPQPATRILLLVIWIVGAVIIIGRAIIAHT